MSTNCNDLFALSEELLNGAKESHHRGAASRAFYAAYHLARMLCEKIRKGPELAGGTHAGLIDELKSYHGEHGADFDRKINQLGFVLEGIRAIRTEADYHLDMQFKKALAEQALLSAKRMEHKIIEIYELLDQRSA